MNLYLDTLPGALRNSRRAVVWKAEVRDGKRTKVPYCATDCDRRIDITDRSTWRSMQDALDAVVDGKADGPGVVLGDGRVGVDLDHCRDRETGEIAPWARTIVAALDSYTEISPSGEGVHILLLGTLPAGRRRQGPMEMYADKRFFTVTGQHLEGTPIVIHERTVELASVHRQMFGDVPDPERSRPARPIVDVDDAELLEKARAAKNGAKFEALWQGDTSGYPSHSEADAALCALLAFWTGADTSRMDTLFRQSGLMRAKWDTRRNQSTYGADTIAHAISRCTEVYDPEILGAGFATDGPTETDAADDTEVNDPAPAAVPAFEIVTPAESFITKFIEYLALRTDAPPEAAELVALGVMSALAGPDVTIPLAVRDKPLTLVLWLMFIVDSTTGRKSTVLEFGRATLEEIISRDCLIEWEGSPQGLVQRLQQRDGKAAVFLRDEYSGLIGSMNRGGHLTGLDQTFIRAYDGRVLENIRVRKRSKKTGDWQNDTDRVEAPYLVTIAAATATSFFTKASIDNVLDGLLTRFVFTTGHATPRRPRMVGAEMLSAKTAMLAHAQRLYDRGRCGCELGIDEEVLERWWQLEEAWRRRAEASRRPEASGAMFKRLSDNVIKVAGLLAFDEDADVPRIEVRHFEAAAAMGERWVGHASGVLDQLGATTFQRDCDAVLASVPRTKTITMAAIYRTHRRLKKKDFDEILQALTLQERITLTSGPSGKKGGRPPILVKRGLKC
jgi:putative DNA primase/helicase